LTGFVKKIFLELFFKRFFHHSSGFLLDGLAIERLSAAYPATAWFAGSLIWTSPFFACDLKPELSFQHTCTNYRKSCLEDSLGMVPTPLSVSCLYHHLYQLS
jgi:hypothetical protein